MNVVSITAYKHRETMALLKKLYQQANLGELDGVAICFKGKHGDEQVSFAGSYKDRPAEGLRAALRISKELLEVNGQ